MDEVEKKLIFDIASWTIRNTAASNDDEHNERGELLMRIETILEPSTDEADSQAFKDEQAKEIELKEICPQCKEDKPCKSFEIDVEPYLCRICKDCRDKDALAEDKE